MATSGDRPEQPRQTFFLGYDIRRVRCRTGCAPIPPFGHMHRGQWPFEARVLSMDAVVCKRPSVLDKKLWDCVKDGRTYEGLYPSYEDASKAFKTVPAEEASFCEIIGIAVTLPEKIPPRCRLSPTDYSRGRLLSGPDATDQGLIHEGYDVVELFDWVSAWTNCGLHTKEMGIDEEKDVTPVYLLRDYDKADRVRVYADSRVPSHAPFAVWSLYSTAK